MSSFYEYFKENMEGMGLPAPESLFGSVTSAVATASTLLGQIDKFGERVTITELLRAGTKLEQLAMIGACSAAFYVGAVIGRLPLPPEERLAMAQRWGTCSLMRKNSTSWLIGSPTVCTGIQACTKPPPQTGPAIDSWDM
jgi:hypothetical protein